MPTLKKQLPERRNQLRNQINASAHSRHPDTLAGLMITAELFAEFASAQGVNLPGDWLADITAALMQAGQDQQQAIATEEPAARFVRLIESALASGRCHLKPMDGKPLPSYEDFTAYGWQLKTAGFGEKERSDWHECGPAIGRFKRDNTPGIYLDPEASYALAQRIAGEQGHPIPLQQRSLHKVLYAKKHLLTRTEPRYSVNVKLPDGSTKRFLHLRVLDKNNGNYGNYGNQEGQDDDLKDKNSVATHENSKAQVATMATVANGDFAAGCHSVASFGASVATHKTEWQPKSEANTLTDKEYFEPVATVAIVATPTNIIRACGVNESARLDETDLALIKAATEKPRSRKDLLRVAGHTALADADERISRLLTAGYIGRCNGGLVRGSKGL